MMGSRWTLASCGFGLAAAALLTGSGVSTASGAILAEESFDYTTGNAFLQNKNGGTGFGSPWYDNSFFGSDPQINTAGSLTYPGYTSASNSVTLSSNFRDAHRLLDTSSGGAFDAYLNGSGDVGADGTELWISYLAGDDDTLAQNGRRVDLRFYRDLSNNTAEPGGSNGTQSLALEMGGLVNSAARLLVAHVQFGVGQDTVTVYIDPDLGQLPTGGTVLDPLDTVDVSFDTLEIAGEYGTLSPQPFVTFDEIRIASTPEAIGFVPEPATFGLAMLGTALLSSRRRSA